MTETSAEVITDTKAKVGKYLTKQNVEIGCLVVLVLVIGFLFYQSFKASPDMSKMTALQAQNEQLKNEKIDADKISNAKIQALKNQLTASSVTVAKLKAELKKGEVNVIPPKDRTETVDRLHKYAPSAH